MKAAVLVTALALACAPMADSAEKPRKKGLATRIQNGFHGEAYTQYSDSPGNASDQALGQAAVNPYHYRSKDACGASQGQFRLACGAAIGGCLPQGRGSSGVTEFVERRLRAGGDWQSAGLFCGADPATGQPAAPAVPSRAQIERAFVELPFAKPTVSIQPRGNVTLVNLPTYYQVTWPETGLSPGDISKPVQLLSWSVEFRVKVDSYTYKFGDGTASKPTTDPGGTYPNGRIRHTYLKKQKNAQVKVDAQLGGDYRVNGGPWQPLAGVADLQDEPVTTLQVKQARVRLGG